MKKYFFFLSLVAVLLNSCNKPEACITASPATAKMGQPITFTDCSLDAKVSKITFGDGSKEKEISGSAIYAYAEPGEFTATLNVYNNRDKRKSSANTVVSIMKPTTAEILGRWKLFKEETVVAGISVENTRNELWEFYSDGTYTVDGGSSYSWSLGNNRLSTDDEIYRITKLYNGELEVRFNETSFSAIFINYSDYNQYYFVQQP
jgi:PKD repeat protein